MLRDDARHHWAAWAGWGLLLVAAWIAYRPGLSGGFLFDDFANLPSLGATGPIDNSAAFWRYLTSGVADPTGRPLSLLSFLLDARDWPAEPDSFLRTNLLLHLFNGSLLFCLLRMLGGHMDGPGRRADAAALLGAGMWLLHPLFVSTTLYIVQREAMLPGTFILLGLLAFAHGRIQLARSGMRRGTAWVVGGVGAGTLFAVLSKANGVLTPLLAWTLDFTVFTAAPAGAVEPRLRARWTAIRVALFALPACFVLAYLASFVPLWNAANPLRDWTVGQRALTEGRVVIEYLHLLLVPRSVSTGLYNDAYLVSSGLLAPLSTLPALLALAAVAGLAFRLRRKAPAVSAAILFFLVGHLLESTLIPLELYFEHRNYVPAMLLFWPVARVLVNPGRWPRLRVAIGIGLLALLAITTFQRATIWGHPEYLAKLWAARNPESSRAQVTAATAELVAGDARAALTRLDPLWRASPRDLQLAFNYVNAACVEGGLRASDSARLEFSLRHADKATLLARQWLQRALGDAAAGSCPGLTVAAVESWIAAAGGNPRLNTPAAWDRSMVSLLALLALERKDPDRALQLFNRAVSANPSPQVAAGQVAALAEAGFYRHALQHLDHFQRLGIRTRQTGFNMARLHEWVLARQGYWPRELAILRTKLEAEIARAPPTPSGPH